MDIETRPDTHMSIVGMTPEEVVALAEAQGEADNRIWINDGQFGTPVFRYDGAWWINRGVASRRASRDGVIKAWR